MPQFPPDGGNISKTTIRYHLSFKKQNEVYWQHGKELWCEQGQPNTANDSIPDGDLTVLTSRLGGVRKFLIMFFSRKSVVTVDFIPPSRDVPFSCLDSSCFASYNSLADCVLVLSKEAIMGTCTIFKMPWMLYLWPGLPQIWRRGAWFGLAMAVGFALLVNLSLMTSLIWSELTSSGMRITSWALVGLVWLASAAASYGWGQAVNTLEQECSDGRQDPSQPQGPEVPLSEGLQYYLQKNWFEAERVFRRLLRRNSRDLDARLMLASLLRHTERFEEAKSQLQRLERIEGSRKWDLEIQQEQRLLDRIETEKKKSDETELNETVSQEETVLYKSSLQEKPQTEEGPEESSADDRRAA